MLLYEGSTDSVDNCVVPEVGYTHCNTLQHAATHSYTLQHAATHFNTLQHTAVQRSIDSIDISVVLEVG